MSPVAGCFLPQYKTYPLWAAEEQVGEQWGGTKGLDIRSRDGHCGLWSAIWGFMLFRWLAE